MILFDSKAIMAVIDIDQFLITSLCIYSIRNNSLTFKEVDTVNKYFSNLLLTFLLISSSIVAAEDLVPSGSIVIEETQVKLLLGGSEGTGTLSMDGKSYTFTVSGMSLGGIGVQKIKLAGEVYNLSNGADLAGDYVSFQAGATAGTASKEAVWMKNSNDVKLKLTTTDAKGLALSISIEGFTISKVQ